MPENSMPREQRVSGYANFRLERMYLFSMTSPEDTHIHERVYVSASRFSAYPPLFEVTT